MRGFVGDGRLKEGEEAIGVAEVVEGDVAEGCEGEEEDMWELEEGHFVGLLVDGVVMVDECRKAAHASPE